jgi:hypothetical protein
MPSVLKLWMPSGIAAAALLGAATVAHGQTFACEPETAGQLSVQAGVRCQCVPAPQGGITGAPGGYAWDCGVLRGRRNQLVPAAPDAYQGPLTDALVIETDKRPGRSEKPRGPSRH